MVNIINKIMMLEVFKYNQYDGYFKCGKCGYEYSEDVSDDEINSPVDCDNCPCLYWCLKCNDNKESGLYFLCQNPQCSKTGTEIFKDKIRKGEVITDSDKEKYYSLFDQTSYAVKVTHLISIDSDELYEKIQEPEDYTGEDILELARKENQQIREIKNGIYNVAKYRDGGYGVVGICDGCRKMRYTNLY
jgi:hypothetical protein